jgi:hypothetical protein
VRHSDVEIQFEVSPLLEVLGIDNGNTAVMDRYSGTTVQTYGGRALMIVRAVGTGDASITAQSPGLTSNALSFDLTEMQ